MKTATTLLPVLSGFLFLASLRAQTPQATELWRATGSSSFEHLGQKLQRTGDLNGDGIQDLMSLSPGADSNFLNKNGIVQARSGADGSLLWRMDGFEDFQKLGQTFFQPGDFTGDGVGDFLLVERKASTNGFVQNGRIFALRGTDGIILWSREGTADFQNLGSPHTVVGDRNGDGINDIFLGAGNASTNGLNFNGFVELISGANGQLIWRRDGTQGGEMMGSSIQEGDDWNGDGTPDLLSMVALAGTNGFFENGAVEAFDAFTGATIWRLDGTATSERVGRQVRPSKDINGDGVKDIMMGSPGASTNGFFSNGIVLAVSGIDGSILWRLDGTAHDQRLGSEVEPTNDLNGDGIGDLTIGDPNASPGGVLEAGEIMAVSGVDGSLIWSIPGTDVFGQIGEALEPIGDQTGDNVEDVLSFSGLADTNGLVDNGFVLLLDGVNGGVVWRLDGAADRDNLGAKVTLPGDLNNDGFRDFVVSSPRVDSGLVPDVGRITAVSGTDGSTLWMVEGTSADERMGGDLIEIADINQDGIQEIIARGKKASTNGLTDNGSVKAVDGKTGSQLWRIDGEQSDMLMGNAIVQTGDLDMDGALDFVLTSQSADLGGLADNGLILAISSAQFLFLNAGDPVAGTVHTFRIFNGNPGSKMHLLASLRGPGPGLISGHPVALTPPILMLGTQTVTANGRASFNVNIPGRASGRSVYLQAVQQTSHELQNSNMVHVAIQ